MRILRDRAGAEVLFGLSRLWPDPLRRRDRQLGGQNPWDPEFQRNYTAAQFDRKVSYGLALGTAAPTVSGQEVLELGCGQGGVTCYLASLGVKRAVGIDLDIAKAEYGRELARRLEQAGPAGWRLPVEFLQMDCAVLDFADESFDLVLADNLFEHVVEPASVLREVERVLRPGGYLAVPVFSSILSKYGLHLKRGLRVPWANLVFSERSIISALQKQAARRPELLRTYPGLRHDPSRIRDVRRHGDLNDITYGDFRRLACEAGLEILYFRVAATPLGRLVRKLIPAAADTRVLDVLSTGASALLRKPDLADRAPSEQGNRAADQESLGGADRVS